MTTLSENMNKLINGYKKMADDNKSFAPELVDMYMDDRQSFVEVRNWIEAEILDEAKIVIDNMDSTPCEEILVAICKDFSIEWVADNLGYNVKPSAVAHPFTLV